MTFHALAHAAVSVLSRETCRLLICYEMDTAETTRGNAFNGGSGVVLHAIGTLPAISQGTQIVGREFYLIYTNPQTIVSANS